MDAATLSKVLRFYKRQDVQEALVRSARGREVGIRFGELGKGDVGWFAKRPDILIYPRDILEFVLKGATSFHISVERWQDPMLLGPHLRKEEVEGLRSGWDLILDIDCPSLELSALGAHFLVQALKYHDISSLRVKFSGNHGFHICVPFEAFPDSIHGLPTKSFFPDGPRKIALYLQEMIRPHLAKEMLRRFDIGRIAELVRKQVTDLRPNGVFDPFEALTIDTVLIASRHLFRAPYSFNEKSGLVSVPVDPSRIVEFDKSFAQPDRVVCSDDFICPARPGEAKRLLVQAFDFKEPVRIEEERPVSRPHELPSEALPEQVFPPCIRDHLSKGIADGKKRAVFVLANFLSSAGWDKPAIEDYVRKWNEKNKEPLREQVLRGVLQHMKQGVLPPNCATAGYYKDMGICHPDSLCGRIKNPVNYAIIRKKMLQEVKSINNKRKVKSTNTKSDSGEVKSTNNISEENGNAPTNSPARETKSLDTHQS